MKLSDAHKHVLRSALGLLRAKKPYRNDFCTGEGSTDWPLCQDLVSLGLMTCQENPRNFTISCRYGHQSDRLLLIALTLVKRYDYFVI